MSGPPLIIDEPARRPPLLRWRDRCLTAALWAAWGQPVEALARLAAGDPGGGIGPDWSAFVADLAAAGRVAGALAALLVGWGAYGRWQRRGVPSAAGRPAGQLRIRTPVRSADQIS